MRRSMFMLGFVVLGLACATSPIGRRQLMVVSEQEAITASGEAYTQQLQQLESEGKLSTDPALNQRVDLITGRLVAQAIAMRPDTAGWEWSVAVIDDPEMVNAWCMAGGRMAIYTGLILKVEPTDDELAQVMGHEIAHALANHTAEKMSTAMAAQSGVKAVSAVTGSGMAASAAAQAAQYAITLPNSRAAETESDRIGIELAAKAGYDPRAAVTLWKKMAAASGEGPPQFMSTHPSPGSRQKELAALIPEMTPYYEAPGERPVHKLD